MTYDFRHDINDACIIFAKPYFIRVKATLQLNTLLVYYLQYSCNLDYNSTKCN